MTQCVAGTWLSALDNEDREAFKKAVDRISRVELYGHICAAHGGKPFGLTALKCHILRACACS